MHLNRAVLRLYHSMLGVIGRWKIFFVKGNMDEQQRAKVLERGTRRVL